MTVKYETDENINQNFDVVTCPLWIGSDDYETDVDDYDLGFFADDIRFFNGNPGMVTFPNHNDQQTIQRDLNATCYNYEGLAQPRRHYTNCSRKDRAVGKWIVTDIASGQVTTVKRARCLLTKEQRRPAFINVRGKKKMAVIIAKRRTSSFVTKVPRGVSMFPPIKEKKKKLSLFRL